MRGYCRLSVFLTSFKALFYYHIIAGRVKLTVIVENKTLESCSQYRPRHLPTKECQAAALLVCSHGYNQESGSKTWRPTLPDAATFQAIVPCSCSVAPRLASFPRHHFRRKIFPRVVCLYLTFCIMRATRYARIQRNYWKWRYYNGGDWTL